MGIILDNAHRLGVGRVANEHLRHGDCDVVMLAAVVSLADLPGTLREGRVQGRVLAQEVRRARDAIRRQRVAREEVGPVLVCGRALVHVRQQALVEVLDEEVVRDTIRERHDDIAMLKLVIRQHRRIRNLIAVLSAQLVGIVEAFLAWHGFEQQLQRGRIQRCIIIAIIGRRRHAKVRVPRVAHIERADGVPALDLHHGARRRSQMLPGAPPVGRVHDLHERAVLRVLLVQLQHRARQLAREQPGIHAMPRPSSDAVGHHEHRIGCRGGVFTASELLVIVRDQHGLVAEVGAGLGAGGRQGGQQGAQQQAAA
mmetsp:Transcript_9291/g.25173  ORF Transcript_9291/g.25173 Transcript_9291/m.25173 type:complete len:312 (-) Transcript_9291:88-1023(-)